MCLFVLANIHSNPCFSTLRMGSCIRRNFYQLVMLKQRQLLGLWCKSMLEFILIWDTYIGKYMGKTYILAFCVSSSFFSEWMVHSRGAVVILYGNTFAWNIIFLGRTTGEQLLESLANRLAVSVCERLFTFEEAVYENVASHLVCWAVKALKVISCEVSAAEAIYRSCGEKIIRWHSVIWSLWCI